MPRRSRVSFAQASALVRCGYLVHQTVVGSSPTPGFRLPPAQVALRFLSSVRAFRPGDRLSPSDPDGEAITPAGLEALEAELEQLQTIERRAMAERLLAARELGDLKENAEYHIAKDDQAHLETKIKRLRERLRNAVVVETNMQDATFDFGRTAEVLDEESGTVQTWTIVGPTEADAAHGRLSAESPVARALLGRAPGDSVEVQTPRGQRKYRIERLVS
jgi:transcription elongation factor GreA